MTEDEIIRVVLAIAIGMLVFTIFKKSDTSISASQKRAQRNARMALVLFIFGACMTLIYMAINADI